MRILVNALSATLGGGITALGRMLPAMLEVDGGGHEYDVLVSAGRASTLVREQQRLRVVETPVGRGGFFGRGASAQLAVQRAIRAVRADVLLSPAGLATFASPIPQVLIFRNVAPFTQSVVDQYRGTFQAVRLPALRWMGILSARAADRVVFISDGQQGAIFPQLGIPASRASRVYLGRAVEFDPSKIARAGPVLERFGIQRPYFLSVSHFYRYQNLVQLVEGFARAINVLPSELKLVLAGPELEADYPNRVRDSVRRLGILDRVIFTGSVPYADLPALYAAADMFLFSTSCESFPNTLIEALASGVATLSSDHSPMPELAGNAARYFDATSPEDIGVKIATLWKDEPARRALSEAAVEQARRYSWRANARGLLSVLESVSGAGQ